MTIEDADRVDSISRTPDGSRYSLLMIEERLFDGSDERFQQLLGKINAYVEYLQTGQFHEQYPDAAGRALEVRLVCREEPVGDNYQALLGAATQLFAKHGAEFIVEVIPTELLGRRAGGVG